MLRSAAAGGSGGDDKALTTADGQPQIIQVCVKGQVHFLLPFFFSRSCSSTLLLFKCFLILSSSDFSVLMLVSRNWSNFLSFWVWRKILDTSTEMSQCIRIPCFRVYIYCLNFQVSFLDVYCVEMEATLSFWVLCVSWKYG